jgi:hypothetical protein
VNDGPQRIMAPDDVPPPTDLPAYWRSRLEDIEAELQAVTRGEVTTIATSPGGRPVFAVSYGEREDFHSRANYNSAVAAGSPTYYARKTESTKPVILLVGPVHGQEVEGIVGAVNLVHILETGIDYRGRDWSQLRTAADRFRFVIVPCGNPDGRARCPYDSFVGVPHLVMTKHGQGTHRDGTLWGWPGAKANHPMRGDVGILGCYYNDDGINMVHDDFFSPMAAETAAILDLARREAPDIVLFLHSNEDPPFVVQTGSVPLLMRRRTREFAQRLKRRLMQESLPHGPIHRLMADDGTRLPGRYFNLDSAAHHVCGATAFAFECIHGVLRSGEQKPPATHEQILDIQLCLYDELVSYTLERRICWG